MLDATSIGTEALAIYNEQMPPTIAKAWVSVARPPHLQRVQQTTRALCRSVGLNESAVYQTVIDVTELAYRLYLEEPRRVDIKLSALRHKDGLELRAENAGAKGRGPVRVSFPFPPASASRATSTS